MTQDSRVPVADFLSAAVAMGRFLKGCSEMPLFTRQFMFLHCIVLFVLSREPGGLPLRALCRLVGLPVRQGQELVEELREAGTVLVKDGSVRITPEGLARLTEVEKQLVPYVEGGMDGTVQFRLLSQQIHGMSRVWAEHSPGAEVSPSRQSGSRSSFAQAVDGVRGLFGRWRLTRRTAASKPRRSV